MSTFKLFQYWLWSSFSYFVLFIRSSSCSPLPLSSPTPESVNLSTFTYITLEEHYDSTTLLPPFVPRNPLLTLLFSVLPPSVPTLLSSISTTRISSMNNNSIAIQVVSNGPSPLVLDSPSLVRTANLQLASSIASSPLPSRFRYFCLLPMGNPSAAVTELRRCISSGGVGALVDAHLPNGTGYDNLSAYSPLWSELARLDVPIYLHPTYPATKTVTAPAGSYAPPATKDGSPPTQLELAVSAVLSTAGWGWHQDAGLQFVRLWLSGTFDAFPKLKIVLGHMGETVPMMLTRVDLALGWAAKGVAIGEAWKRNVWVTTSGFFELEPFVEVLKVTDVDRIMYSVDYPWSTNEKGSAFMEMLRTSGLVPASDWNEIAFGNAQELLRIHK